MPRESGIHAYSREPPHPPCNFVFFPSMEPVGGGRVVHSVRGEVRQGGEIRWLLGLDHTRGARLYPQLLVLSSQKAGMWFPGVNGKVASNAGAGWQGGRGHGGAQCQASYMGPCDSELLEGWGSVISMCNF